MPSPKVCVGAIAGAHGVRGLVKVKAFTEDPAAVSAYGPVSDEAGGRRFALTLLSRAKEQWVARIEGVDSREAAEALRGTRLYVERRALPEPEEEEFYHADLLGLRAEWADGRPFGTVRAVHDFGAGDLLEIAPAEGGPTVMLPFTRAVVPVVDVAGGRVVVEPPEDVGRDEEEQGGGTPPLQGVS